MSESTPYMAIENVSKIFGSYEALSDVSLDIHAGQVLCLLGDNGAGKSTLIKVLSGFHEPTSGTVKINGKPVQFKSPRDATAAGISTVHQFGGTFPLMSLGRSFFTGVEPTKGWGPFKYFDKKFANKVVVEQMQEMGITRVTDGDRFVGSLSGGERQVSAIARAVYFGAKVLILDEPTAALGVKEAAHVLRIIMQAKHRGIAVVLVTHNVSHALTVGDHFAVLIRGEKADDFAKGQRTREEITDLMAGGEAMAELEAELASLTGSGDSIHD
ncbi:ATP-binding cassette domain-containing protein [Nocardioides bruguierae]|uniref:ATP-binding cassette domain-containing protein n=1 Tax=Nocardioides bruguierae TaxID=2945102 RepID=A0A9X2DAA2_9ACTN|nr:ATP-binding cassette domain-containing protein [Nocardioides bruguierae]MCL8024465.1 ATP-binding cassette domain-containing protein [Nocardioides bruguierae]MCM0620894.1 ATP-binding cassette domain-containing protein [Nocardioides bruguierae]